MSRRCLIELQTWQCVLYLVGHLVAKRRVPELRGVSAAAEERGKRRLLPSRAAGHTANFCSRRVGTRRRRYDKKIGGLGTLRCALQRHEVAFSRSSQPACTTRPAP